MQAPGGGRGGFATSPVVDGDVAAARRVQSHGDAAVGDDSAADRLDRNRSDLERQHRLHARRRTTRRCARASRARCASTTRSARTLVDVYRHGRPQREPARSRADHGDRRVAVPHRRRSARPSARAPRRGRRSTCIASSGTRRSAAAGCARCTAWTSRSRSTTSTTARPIVGNGADRQALADRMSRAWVAFARSGDPNHAGTAALGAVHRDRARDDDAEHRVPPRARPLSRRTRRARGRDGHALGASTRRQRAVGGRPATPTHAESHTPADALCHRTVRHYLPCRPTCPSCPPASELSGPHCRLKVRASRKLSPRPPHRPPRPDQGEIVLRPRRHRARARHLRRDDDVQRRQRRDAARLLVPDRRPAGQRQLHRSRRAPTSSASTARSRRWTTTSCCRSSSRSR